MQPFLYQGNPARVIFGAGRLADLGVELGVLGVRRPLLLTTPQQVDLAQRATDLLVGGNHGVAVAGTFADAAMHTPVEVTTQAVVVFEDARADGMVALGGGSTIGLGKALALRNGLPLLAVPTTYAGSEMTAILGETEAGQKTTQVSPRVLPRTVIYDVDLTMGLPVDLAVVSGFNAMAHAVEALYAENANPVMSLMAEEGLRALAAALPAIVTDPQDVRARADALYGAWLCGTCLGGAGMALHHKICHVLGGGFNLPHAETHTVMLPHALAYNGPAIPGAMAALRRALGTDDPALALYVLAQRLDAPVALSAIGMPDAGLDRAVALALSASYANPRPLEAAPLRAMLARAWAGQPPLAG